MKSINLFFVIAFVLPLLLIVRCCDAVDSDPKGGKSNPAVGAGDVKLAPPIPGKVEEEKKGTDETKKGQVKIDSKENPIAKKDRPAEDPKVQEKEGKGSSNGESDVKNLNNGDSRVMECDPANRCMVEKSMFIACLRVPGKDSLDLSLLIQNKGTGSLEVDIIAPDFVNLEHKRVQLKAKEDGEVKVLVRDGANDTVIVLRAGEGNCSLDFQNMISNSVKKSETSAVPRYWSRLFTRFSFMAIFLGGVVIIGLASLCIKFQLLKQREGGLRYEKATVGLPVSTGRKMEADEADGWENSWGDNWDDEEAPMTPSKPVLTPSSKGLASRKFNKDGWKD